MTVKSDLIGLLAGADREEVEVVIEFLAEFPMSGETPGVSSDRRFDAIVRACRSYREGE